MNNAQTKVDLPDDVVLRVDNVSKKFCRNLKRSMWYGVTDLAKNFIGGKGQTSVTSVPSVVKNLSAPPASLESTEHTEFANQERITRNEERAQNTDGLRPSEFWALKNISFELKRGECLGLIGQNGCGKSTLLRLIAGIFPPDQGSIAMRGRVGALIALGAGFHPHLTGRENIFLNGAILGLSQSDIRGKMDEILEFAEIDEFIDAPVSTYSSGMRVRLGFSIAVTVKPDLFLVDEVLAVGDAGFQVKCLNAIDQVCQKSAVIFVSHNMALVSKICNSVMFMEFGAGQYFENRATDGIQHYLTSFKFEEPIVVGEGLVTVDKATVGRRGGDGCFEAFDEINYGQDIVLRFSVAKQKGVGDCLISMTIVNQQSNVVAALMTGVKGKENSVLGVNDQCVEVLFRNVLAPGVYYFNISFSEVIEINGVLKGGKNYGSCRSYARFSVVGSSRITNCPVHIPSDISTSRGFCHEVVTSS